MKIRTKGMIISSMYSHMKQASVKQPFKYPKFTRKELKDWCYAQPLFHKLYDTWVEKGCKQDDIPTIDRLDDYIGYQFDNMQLLAFYDNRCRMYKDKREGRNTKVSKAVEQLTTAGKLIKTYHSTGTASRETGIARNGISRCCSGHLKTAGGFVWRFK